MEEKYGKSNEKFKEKNQTPRTIKDLKKQQNQMFIPDIRGIQEIL